MFTRFATMVSVVLASLLLAPLGPAHAAPARPIAPGVTMVTAGHSCTAAFVMRRGAHVYLAYAAHCAATDPLVASGQVPADGCTAASLPLGTRVRFTDGGRHTLGQGALRYSSWLAMRHAGVTGSACTTDDLALVQVDRATARLVNPTMPFWGGPVALGPSPAAGGRVFTTGHTSTSSAVLDPRSGTVSGSGLDLPAPSSPLDSGSGVLDATGHAVGLLASGDRMSALADAVAFARSHGVRGLRLVPGRVGFDPTATF